MQSTDIIPTTPDGIRVTVTDLKTGESESREIWDDFMVVTAGNREITSVVAYGNGTQVVTVKAVR
ncbi:hypothetical protein [Leifsonia sp. WHRI 6310E]|uniref:hypothetical protein n=1 Tax=Leifsonia sp. WHRI 6310E TaxID=3162562 RepID=UPI0032F01796